MPACPPTFPCLARATRGNSAPKVLIAILALMIGASLAWVFAIKSYGPKKSRNSNSASALAQPTPPANPSASGPQIPFAPFKNITRDAGIDFHHVSGAYGDKLLPESMGGGVAFFDYDGDGAPDLLLVNSNTWPGHPLAQPSPPTMALYHNDGHGHFANVTAGSGLDVSFYGMGVAIGDYDNDGRPDVFISGVNGNHLFHNEGNGHFREVTKDAGVGGSGTDWSTSCAWIDYDNDGQLDLFVCNYVRWSPQIDQAAAAATPGPRTYAQPTRYEGTFCFLYHNEGNGHFRDVSASAGIQVKNASGAPAAKAMGVVPIDLDGDGFVDLVVSNDGLQNFVFHNEGNGTFKEIGALSGAGFDNLGRTRGGMGIDASHFANDPALGILVGNFANEMSALYVSDETHLNFTDEGEHQGIGPAGVALLKFGAFFFDYDNDGRLDALFVDGHLDPDIDQLQPGQHYRQPAQLFWNNGSTRGSRFVLVPPAKCGSDLVTPMAGRGSAFADIDGDGDPDVIITQVDGSPMLLRNDQALGHHFLRLKLVGTRSNRDAIGAWIRVHAGSQTLSREVMPTRSYLSQSELPVTIGLGEQNRVDDVEIIWPRGLRQHLAGSAITVDHAMTVEEPRDSK
jgi:enediyne biosynthesis protein E4